MVNGARCLIVAFVAMVMVPTVASAAALRTNVIWYAPWDDLGNISPGLHVGRPVAGRCWTASLATTRNDAWRCMDDATSEVRDPCFRVVRQTVVCPVNPFSSSAVLMHVSTPIDTRPPERTDRYHAWALRLANGSRCAFVSGATAMIAGMRLNYACTNGTALLGEPDRSSEPWTIDAVTSQSDVHPTRVSIAAAVL